MKESLVTLLNVDILNGNQGLIQKVRGANIGLLAKKGTF